MKLHGKKKKRKPHWESVINPKYENIQMKNQDLECRFFYRLVKVVYYIFLFLFLTLVFYFGYSSMPKKYVDNDKSYLVCETGLYLFNDVGIYFWNENNSDKYLSTSSDVEKKAEEGCSRKADMPNTYETQEVTPESERAEKRRKELLSKPNHGSYTFSIEFKTEGSWKETFEWWLEGGGLIYIILNLIKETLIYLAFGRKFTWDWLIKIYHIAKARV